MVLTIQIRGHPRVLSLLSLSDIRKSVPMFVTQSWHLWLRRQRPQILSGGLTFLFKRLYFVAPAKALTLPEPGQYPTRAHTEVGRVVVLPIFGSGQEN